MTDLNLLPGVPTQRVRARLEAADGKELATGKFNSPESSSALAVDCFGWFLDRPERLPTLPSIFPLSSWNRVEIEYQARFPWSGGRHPWLDAAAFTSDVLVGIESKRFEPFRDRKIASLSDAYDRPVWGDNMGRYETVRDALREGALTYRHLDAAQLVKHAFGLVTEAARHQLKPALFYIFLEPTERSGKAIPPSDLKRHRDEVSDFASRVAGDEVDFAAASYSDWLKTWPEIDAELHAHASALKQRYSIL